MNVTQVIIIVLLTLMVSITLAAVCYGAYRVVKYARALIAVLRGVRMAAINAGSAVEGVREELVYMRNLTRQTVEAAGGQMPSVPEPPIGRRAPMPEFPARSSDLYRTAEATPEDTDRQLLEQDEDDVAAAQYREELRSKGIEPEEDAEPPMAVREEA